MIEVEPGHQYKFRVIAVNRVGDSAYSPFSDIIMAASEPGRIDQPWYVASTSFSMSLAFDKVSDDGGSPVSYYNLYVDKDTGSGYELITSYNGKSLEWTVDQADESDLVTGNVYKFKVSAVNVIGEGELSNHVTIALSSRVSTPTTPTVNRALSSLTSLHIEWSEGTPGDIPVDGYQLWMIDM